MSEILQTVFKHKTNPILSKSQKKGKVAPLNRGKKLLLSNGKLSRNSRETTFTMSIKYSYTELEQNPEAIGNATEV
jgi:hypothetical protein